MRRKWEKLLNRLLTFAIVAVLLPLVVTIVMQRMELEEVIYGGKGAKADMSEEDLIGIVAKEIDIEAEREAILAQCVVARTNYYDAKKRGLTLPETLSESELKKLWGDSYEKNYRLLADCIQETSHQVLTWNGESIYAAYHALSAGSTRNMQDVYPETKMPYLSAVPCVWDITAEGYLGVYYLEKKEITDKCRDAFPDAELPEDDGEFPITVESRDEAGYVLQVKVGGTVCTGEEFRACMELPSACFSVMELDGKIRIVTKGIGHGLGLSIHSAGEMAKEGMKYQEILSYFYPNTELKEKV